MSNLGPKLHLVEKRFTRWLIVHSLAVPRVSLGTVFVGFSVLKPFPGVSPAQELVERTTDVFSLWLLPVGVGIVMVATPECVIGPGLI